MKFGDSAISVDYWIAIWQAILKALLGVVLIRTFEVDGPDVSPSCKLPRGGVGPAK